MSPRSVRRLVHAVHAVTTLALFATGLLLEWPDLRGRVVGGYGRQIADIHVYLGWAFAAVPAAAIAAAPPLLADVRHRLGPLAPTRWSALHVAITLVASALLILTGIVLWGGDSLPLVLQDVSLEIHIWATWVVAASLPVHLFVARRKIAERVRLLFTGEPPPLFEFADDEDDEV